MALKDTVAGVVNAAKAIVGDDGSGDDRPAKGSEPNAIEILKEDHRRVEALFKEILSEKSNALMQQRSKIAAVLAELTLHAKVEETLFYPAVYKKTSSDTEPRLEVLEAFEEHASMKELIKKLKKLTGRDESRKAKVKVLSEITEHHVKEEESDFFPDAQKLLGEEKLRELGQAILKLKSRSMRSPAGKRPRKVGAKKARAVRRTQS
jgi:hemerythrin superfamily protein